MADTEREFIFNVLRQRYDYYAAQSALKNARKGTGLPDKESYNEEEVRKLASVIAAEDERAGHVLKKYLSDVLGDGFLPVPPSPPPEAVAPPAAKPVAKPEPAAPPPAAATPTPGPDKSQQPPAAAAPAEEAVAASPAAEPAATDAPAAAERPAGKKGKTTPPASDAAPAAEGG